MNLREARTLIFNTHIAALKLGQRALSYEMRSGPGIGKSSIVNQTAADLCVALGEPVGELTEMLATLSSADVRGFMLPTKNAAGELVSVFSVSPLIPRRDNIVVYEPDASSPDGYKRWPVGAWQGEVPEVGIIFLDEFGQAEDETKKPAADFVLKGAIGSHTLPLGWRVLMASNRMSDRSGVVRPLMHIVNRRGDINIEGSYPIWNEDFVQKQPEQMRPHFLIASFAQANPQIVFKDATPTDGNPYCTPRTLTMMGAELKALRTEAEVRADAIPLDPLARELMASWIGEADAAQFIAHAKYFDQLPTMEAVEKTPLEAKVPPNMDGQMVCAHMLSHHVHKGNARSVMRYIERMNIEMQALMVRNIHSQKDKVNMLAQTPEWSAWIVKNADLIIASRS